MNKSQTSCQLATVMLWQSHDKQILKQYTANSTTFA